MCHPAIPIAMMVAGTLIKRDKADQAISRQEELTRKEIKSQGGLEGEARTSQQAALAKVDPSGARGASETGERRRLSDLYDQGTAGIKGMGGGGGDGPAVITEGDALVSALARRDLRDRADQMGRMDAFGSAVANAVPGLNESSARTGMLGNFMGASSSVYGQEMEDAYKRGYSTLGDLLQMGGSAGLSSSLRGQRTVNPNTGAKPQSAGSGGVGHYRRRDITGYYS